MKQHTAYLLLGSNVGDRRKHLREARETMAGSGVIIAESNIYETAPWGYEEQGPFLNQAISLRTERTAADLLAALKAAERRLGRTAAPGKWMAREIDMDILFFNNEVIREKELVIPHPALHERRFTLVPLCDIAPDYMHPVLRATVRDLLSKCPDRLAVILSPPNTPNMVGHNHPIFKNPVLPQDACYVAGPHSPREGTPFSDEPKK